MPGGCEKVTGNGNPEKFEDYPWWDGAPMATDLIRFPNSNGEQGPDRLNGTKWVDYMFLNESLNIINQHDTSAPLFLLHSFHSIHAPLNADAELYNLHPDGNYMPPPCEHPDSLWPEKEMRTCFKTWPGPSRKSYAAMVTWTDKAIGDVIDRLKAPGVPPTHLPTLPLPCPRLQTTNPHAGSVDVAEHSHDRLRGQRGGPVFLAYRLPALGVGQ